METCNQCKTPDLCRSYTGCLNPAAKEKAERPSDATDCSLSSLNDAARRYRKEYFLKSHSDPTDKESREAYYYEEGRTRAYSEGLNALSEQKAIARQRIESLKDHCRAVNPTWAWLMREVLEIVDPQSPENANCPDAGEKGKADE